MQVTLIAMISATCAASLSCSSRQNPRSPDRVVKTVENQAFASVGSGSYGSVAVHERQGGRFVLRPLRPISPEQRDGYGGHDVFTVKDGRLRRTFPRYLLSDTNAEPTGGTTRLWYAFDEDRWVEDHGT